MECDQCADVLRSNDLFVHPGREGRHTLVDFTMTGRSAAMECYFYSSRESRSSYGKVECRSKRSLRCCFMSIEAWLRPFVLIRAHHGYVCHLNEMHEDELLVLVTQQTAHRTEVWRGGRNIPSIWVYCVKPFSIIYSNFIQLFLMNVFSNFTCFYRESGFSR